MKIINSKLNLKISYVFIRLCQSLEYQDTLKLQWTMKEVLSKIHIHDAVDAELKITLEICHMLLSNKVMVSIPGSVKYIYF